MNISLIKAQIVSIIIIFFSFNVQAQEKSDSITYKNFIKIDLAPIIYDISYYRQLRMGLEYERTINNKLFVATNLDWGIYDEYSFTKYYDFFNQNQGLYYIQQNVFVKGFHLLPKFCYFLISSKKKSNQGLYSGIILDFQYYQKRIKSINSQTQENIFDKYSQIKLGIGINAGYMYKLTKHIYAEVNSSIFIKSLTHSSSSNKNEIRPLNAQWFDSKYNFWFVSNIMIGYAF